MSSSPDPRPPSFIPPPQPRVLRGTKPRTTAAVIDAVEGLLYTMDGRPVSAEVKAAQEAGYQKGWDAGWKDGFDAGRIEGRARAQQETAAELVPALSAVRRAVADLERQERVTLEQLEGVAVELVYHLVEALLDRELELTDAPVRDSLARALRLVPDRGAVVVRLHPDDVHVIASMDEDPLPGRVLDLVGDPRVERGGCIVDVGACRVDAQIGAALDRAREVLAGSRPRRHREAGE
jgi:flagellar assembly protein FliH